MHACASITRGLACTAEVAPFFADLPARIAAAHLVVARSGASTVAELSVIGRASILVPLPHALDQDQAANAGVLAGARAATLVQQSAFTPAWLSRELQKRLADPAGLRAEGERAKAIGIPDAAERLAELAVTLLPRSARASLQPPLPDSPLLGGRGQDAPTVSLPLHGGEVERGSEPQHQTATREDPRS